MPNFEIRPITSTDIPKIRQLHSTLLPINYPLSFYLQLLLHPSHLCLIAHHQNSPQTPVAFISASIVPPSPRTKGRSRSLNSAYATLPLPGPSGVIPPPRVEIFCDEPRVHILTLGVLPDFQSHGLLRKLVVNVVHSLRKSFDAGLTVSSSPEFTPPNSRGTSIKSPVPPYKRSSRDGTLVTAQISSGTNPHQKLYHLLGMEPDHNMARDLQTSQLLIGRVH